MAISEKKISYWCIVLLATASLFTDGNWESFVAALFIITALGKNI